MEVKDQKAVKIFYCYARRDKQLRDELDVHLSSLKHQSQVISWFDHEISPGQNWREEIHTNLNTADIILLLISPDFMNSDYCYGVEMKRALERHEEGSAYVIPVLLRPVYWSDAPFSKLQILPTNAIPITSWSNRDEAYFDIGAGVRRVIGKLASVSSEPLPFTRIDSQSLLKKTKEYWLQAGDTLFDRREYEDAFGAYEQAILLDPNDADAYRGKGNVLFTFGWYEEAFDMYRQAIRLDLNSAVAYWNKGNALYRIGGTYQARVRNERSLQALDAYEQSIRLKINNAAAYCGKGNALVRLMRFQEALDAYEQAITFDPNYITAYWGKGCTLYELKRFKESLEVFNRIIQLDANNADAYCMKGNLLYKLKQYPEAFAAYEKTLLIKGYFRSRSAIRNRMFRIQHRVLKWLVFSAIIVSLGILVFLPLFLARFSSAFLGLYFLSFFLGMLLASFVDFFYKKPNQNIYLNNAVYRRSKVPLGRRLLAMPFSPEEKRDQLFRGRPNMLPDDIL